MDPAERDLMTQALRRAMTAASGRALDAALAGLGWPELLAQAPDVAIPVAFGLLGETGAHAPLLNDVLLGAAGRPLGGTLPLPYAGGSWVVWERAAGPGPVLDSAALDSAVLDSAALDSAVLDSALPLRQVPGGQPVPLAAGRVALGWWLVGTGRAMLALARSHATGRVQFGRPLAAFQAVRHRLAESRVALDGAEAALLAAGVPGSGLLDGDAAEGDGDLGALLAKAAAGQAALTAARHCQQVLGGIGFTAEHGLHRQVRRALVLDGLLGSSRELTREAGALLQRQGSAPRLVQL